MKAYLNFILKISSTCYVSFLCWSCWFKKSIFFNAYIITSLRLGVKISHVTKEHDIIGGMNFPSHKLLVDWFIVLANPMFSYYKSWMICG